MAYLKCSSCGKWYESSLGGCTNAGCGVADRSRTNRMVTAPVHPATKAPVLVATTAKPRPLTSLSQPKPIEQPKQPLQEIKLKPTGASVVTPVAVPESAGEALLDTEMHQLEAGHHILYRGDTRSPAQLKGFGGFTAWVPLDVEGARQVVRRGMGQNFAITLPTKAKRLQDLFNSDKCQSLTLLTLARQIKLEKAGDTFHISTDPSEACGGYDSGYVYAMRFKTLYMVDKVGNSAPANFQGISRVNTKLVMDSTRLQDANIIAVAIDPEEVAFLTSVTMAHIYKYKEPKGTVWYKMPA